MDILTLKAIHIIGFVAWFAGLFYLVRLFVYHAEALSQSSPERDILSRQYSLMEKRLFNIITRPAMIITFVAGIAMLVLYKGYLQEGWMHIKLTLLILLAAYSERCSGIIKRLARGETPMQSRGFRIYNEVPTIFLIVIVILAVFKNQLSLVALISTIIGSIVIIGLFFFIYSKRRQKKAEE
ncbi:MAG: protoporphyrinogen oxidase HemJ [Saprospiraceae bacterium]|nr:protoporphyrinogen oxidase HemJ [Saprospiraceae bacterium]